MYDFWNSPYFQPSDIRNTHIKNTIERIKENQVILAIQDTTNIDLTGHPATSGIGYLDHRKSSGLKVHSTFAATTQGVPVGIINQQVWARVAENLGIAKKRRQSILDLRFWIDCTHKGMQLGDFKFTVFAALATQERLLDLFHATCGRGMNRKFSQI